MVLQLLRHLIRVPLCNAEHDRCSASSKKSSEVHSCLRSEQDVAADVDSRFILRLPYWRAHNWSILCYALKDQCQAA